MTNWPNIQEYRNFEAKFINDPTNNLTINSAIEGGSILKNDLDDFINCQQYQNLESKTVRCVIKKDFEEAFKKLDRGDGVGVNSETAQAKPQETSVVNQVLVDQIRVQNHLKWKKQKAEEYQLKKKAERIAQLKQKEEELRLERIKKMKEKEREEKLREWQEQKAREKDEKKKEKMVLKVLEKELKVTPTVVDKEKLIGEWVKLKDKQRQMEAEKRAELQKKEEENREMRQNLAKLSYKQWKERVKGRMMTLPKNGYQIFGPKPEPVVKEDWNHNFTSSSPRNQSFSIRHTKSNTTTSLTFRPALKELGHLSKNVFYLGDLKSKSPSLFHLRTSKSGMNLSGNSELFQRTQVKLPLKELQQGTINSHQTPEGTLKNNIRENEALISQYLSKTPNIWSNGKEKYNYLNQYSPSLLNLLSMAEDQNQFSLMSQCKKVSNLMHALPNRQVLPNKKRLDLYLNAQSDNSSESPPREQKRKESLKSSAKKPSTEDKKDSEKKTSKPALEIKSREKFHSRTRVRSTSLQKEVKSTDASAKKTTDDVKGKICRKSRSCEKPLKKFSREPPKVKYSSSSKSLTKANGKTEDGCKKFGATKSMTCCLQKRKSKKQLKPETPAPAVEKSSKKTDSGSKVQKKLKKNGLLKSFSFSDSPYDSKGASKSTTKVKGRRKVTKDGGTKSDGAGRSRKLSTTKI